MTHKLKNLVVDAGFKGCGLTSAISFSLVITKIIYLTFFSVDAVKEDGFCKH